MGKASQTEPVVLLVDDSEESLEVLSVLLASLKCRIVTAKSGEEALEVAGEVSPALILLDVSMPGMDGFEVCRRLRQEDGSRDSTILFVSALGDLESRVKGLQGGGVDYIAKPFEPEEVIARVSTQLELYKLRRELVERNRELQQLVDEKQRFLDLAAHELRHPLLQIRGLIGLLRSGQVEEQGRESLVKTIAQAGKQMNHILNDLIDLSDGESDRRAFRPEIIPLGSLIKKLVAIWRPRADSKSVSLLLECEEAPDVRYDRAKLTQVLETVLARAVEAVPAGGTLRVTASASDSKAVISLNGSGGEWRLVFSQLLGEPGKPDDKPTSQSLSLAIAGKLLRRFQATVVLNEDSEENQSLTIELPLH